MYCDCFWDKKKRVKYDKVFELTQEQVEKELNLVKVLKTLRNNRAFLKNHKYITK